MPLFNFTGRAYEGRAVYTYAAQLGASDLAVRKPSRLVSGLNSGKDLDFLDPANPFFLIDRFLLSPGGFLHERTPNLGMFRKRPHVTVIGDSGGYQFIKNPGLWRGDETREWVLRFQEMNCHEAVTLDIPSAAVQPLGPWPSFADALQTSVDSLDYFNHHRRRDKAVRHLNALQGRNQAEADTWFQAVKGFPGGGWAFGGPMRENFAYIVRRLRQLAEVGLLGPAQNRVHVLGKSQLINAVALSAIQRGMRKRLDDPKFLITFDTSNPSRIAANALAYSFADLKNMTLPTVKPPTSYDADRSTIPWPCTASPLGSQLTYGDMNVDKPGINVAQTAWDGMSYALLIHHNLFALLHAIDTANRVLELSSADALKFVPELIVTACRALEHACVADDFERVLRNRKAFEAISKISNIAVEQEEV
jgi:hypothetical protein